MERNLDPAPAPAHAPAPQHLQGVNSGWDQGGIIEDGSKHFDEYYSIDEARDRNRTCVREFRLTIPNLQNSNITYVTYCWEYLTNQRQYFQRNNGNSNRVTYGACDDYTNCFLDQSRNKNGQYKVYEEGQARGRPITLFGDSRTYHLYGQADRAEVQLTRVALERVVTARVVSISVRRLQQEDITGTSLNYCNAALLELYREMNGQESLRGTCEISTPPRSDQKIDDLGDDLQNLTVSKT